MNDSGQFNHDRTPLSEQAAHWWVILHEEDCTPADRKAFADWVSRSPERIEAFLRASMVTSALQSGSARWPDTPAGELIKQALATGGEVVSSQRFAGTVRHTTDARRERSSKWNTRMLMYTSMAAVLIAAVLVWTFDSQNRYRTRIGEQRSVLLEDGSLVMLNTSSAVEVVYSEQRRLIRLTQGEALFQVAHDTARPFDVSAGNVTIRAVGTQFNVDRRADRTTVTVVEGKVKVSAQSNGGDRHSRPGSNEPPEEFLEAAQRIVVTEARISAPEPVLNVAPVTAWTRRQLVFEDRPLHEVAEEFNRYNRHQVLIESPELKSQRVTGVFQANDASSFIAFISGIPGVSLRTTREGHLEVTMNAHDAGGAGVLPEAENY